MANDYHLGADSIHHTICFLRTNWNWEPSDWEGFLNASAGATCASELSFRDNENTGSAWRDYQSEAYFDGSMETVVASGLTREAVARSRSRRSAQTFRSFVWLKSRIGRVMVWLSLCPVVRWVW